MESAGCKDGPGNSVGVSSKLRSPSKVNDSHTMDSFQDGGQQNMGSEQNDFPPPLDGPHMNSEMNNYQPGPGDQGMPPEGFNRMNEGMNPGQLQAFGYNRGNYNMGDQHGGLNMAGSPDYAAQGPQYHGQYPQAGMRSGYPTGPKPSMGHVRPGMSSPGMGMMPPGYNSGNPRMMSGQSIAQQGGPTPTLNQLLQTPNSTQRFQNSYNDYGGGPQKSGGDMGGGDPPYGVQQGWANQRPVNPYSQGPMPGNAPYRNQSGPMPPEMNQQRRQPGMPPSYPSQSGQYGGQQFSPNSQPQRYGIMSNPGRMMPGQMGQMNQPYNQQMAPQYGHHQGGMSYSSQSMTPQQPAPPLQQSPQTVPPSSQSSGPYLSPPQSGSHPPTSAASSGGSGSPSSQSSPQPVPQQRVTPPLVKPHAMKPHHSSFIQQQQSAQNHPSQQHHHQQQNLQSMGQPNAEQSPEGFSNSRQTPSKQSNQENDMEVNSNFDENSDGGRLSTPPSSSSGPQHPVVSSLRPVTSPAGSTGSRSNTPASLTGTQAGSPMPPRPPSRQLDGQSRMSNQSPMPTSYNQQMMPPPLGPNQMGYGGGNKMGSGPQMGSQMGQQMGHFPQYNSQFHQGNFSRQPGPGPGPGSGMQGYAGPHQNNFNGPNQMSSNSMYGNMNRNVPNMPNMPNSGYTNSFTQGNNMHMGMGNQYGNYNATNSHSGTPGTNSTMSMNSMGPPVNSGMPNMGSGPGGPPTSAKGAQAAAQAAMLAAANSAVNRPQAGIRPAAAPMTNHHRMFAPQNMNQMGSMNSMAGGYPGMNQMSNSQPLNQMPNAMSQSPVPSSMNQMPNSMSETGGMPNSSGMPMMPHTTMSSSANMPNSNMSNMSMPNTSTPHSGMPGVSSLPSHSSPMPNIGMPHSGFPTNSSNPLSNMANMSAGIMSSNPPGSGIPNTSMSNSSLASSVNSVSSDSGVSSLSSVKMCSSSSGSGPTPPLLVEGKQQNSATPPSSMGLSGTPDNTMGSVPSSAPSVTGSIQALPSQSSQSSAPPTSVPSSSASQNCAPPTGSGDDVKPQITTATTNSVTTSTVVTQSITSPVTSITENSNSSSTDAQSDNMVNLPVVCTPVIVEETPEKKKKEGVGLPQTQVGIAPSPGTASVSSFHEEFDNISSPGWPGTPKSGTPDLSKLFEMGDEPNRRPFLENLFLYLEEKGTPVTAMPSISKQPLDLYKLYLQVKEKGGMVEVTKTKKWKEICGVVNIGASASAAFTLKKNYIKYLFSYECKFDKGGIDPAPILAQMEAALQQKRESKNRARAPSPANSQGSQDAFRPPSTPNNQGMDTFHPGMQQPGGYMGNDVGMGPMGSNMMPPNSMMNNMGGPMPNMPPPGAMGSMQPHPMPHQSMGPGGSMQGPGGMMHGNMPQNSMMPHNNFNMQQNSMMVPGPNSNGMPPPQPNANMMPNNSDSVSVQDPFADEPNTNPNTQYPRYGGNNQMPYSGGMQPPATMNSNFNQYGSRGGIPSSSVPVPPYNSTAGHHGNSNYSDTMNRVPNQEPFNESYRRPPGPPGPPGPSGSTDGYNSSQPTDPYNSGNSGQFSGNRINQAGPASGPFPYGQQQQFDRFDPQGSMAPPGNQPFRSPGPGHPQSSMGGAPPPPPPPQQQHGPDQMYPGRYGSQQTSPRPQMPQQNQFNQPTPFQNQSSGFPTPSKTMGGPDQYRRYPTPPPPPHQQQPSTPQSQSSPFPSQRPIYGTPPKRYPDMPDRRDYNMPPAYCPQPSMYGEKSHMGSGYGHPHRQGMLPPHHDGQMADSRGQWSPMPRYPHQHQGSPYSGSMGNMPPSHPPNMSMSYSRNRQMSPQTDKYGYPSPPKKGGMMHHAPLIPKKEIIFPPDSIEATQPLLAKRKKLNSKDVGPVEAWRLMMALKSGMLAESTWALDTLSVMLYDDQTVGYFGLIHLPGLLEVLVEHFRQCLIQIFGYFEELEIKKTNKLESPRKKLKSTSEVEGDADELMEANVSMEEIDSDSRLVVPDLKETKDSFKMENFTYITRQGKTVKVEENSKDAAVMADSRDWDTFVGFESGLRHWKVGCGETTKHIATHFENDDNLSIMKALFYRWIRRNGLSKNKSEKDETEKVESFEDSIETVELSTKEKNVSSPSEDSDKTEVEEETVSEATNSNKTNCVCDSDRMKNDFHKVTIKSEPVDPEDIEPEPPKLSLNEDSESKAKSPEVDKNEEGKEPENVDSKDDSSAQSNDKAMENSDSTKESGENNFVQNDKDSVSNKPYLACFFSSENTKDLLRGFKRPLDDSLEVEAYQRDEPALCLTSSSKEETSRRCICVSNIIRSLSFIPGNDKELSKHAGLLYVLGKLLLLHHTHQLRPKKQPKLDHDDTVSDDMVDLTHGAEGWWWDCLNALRENTLVTLANISGKLNLSKYPEEVCLPLLDGLLHWSVCPSACAQDPLPTMPSTSVLSPQRLVLETMCKLSIQEGNVDLLLATPPFNRIVQLFSNLCKLLANKKQQVTQEFAIVLLAALVQGDSSAARAIAMQHPCISLLIDFLETAEQSALQVANTHGVQMLRENPETMGTSLDMLRRAASTLVHMARVPENRTLFVHHQSRLLALVMSQILDQHVAQILAEVLYECSQS